MEDIPGEGSAGARPDTSSLREAAMRAAVLIKGRPRGTHWLLACDTDADGLCAAAVTARALLRIGHRFTARPSRAKDEAAYRAALAEPFQGIILLDKGTSHAALLAAAATPDRPVLVVDHHNPHGLTPDAPGFAMVNPRMCGLDGSRDASGATTAVALALALCGDEAWGWASVGLSGAIGDWQQRPSWQGWNLEILERCRADGTVAPVVQPRFIGADLAEAMARFRPPIPGLHGNPQAAWQAVQAEGLNPTADVEDLNPEEQARLVSMCALRLLGAGEREAVARLVAPTDHNVRLGTSLRHVFRIVDACGREGEPTTGIAYLMGDPSAKAEAMACLRRYKVALVAGLRVLREKGLDLRRAVGVAWTERADYTGMVAGVAMTVMLEDRVRPIAVLAKRPDGLVQVSTRGTEEQVRAGLDLGRACQLAAAAVGKEGGGHPVAAGAVIGSADVEAFLGALDAALVAQGFVKVAA
ncbi:MAG: DHHA1 domain-containing protein [bacterium]